ncbi:MAG: PKD domain-containing protein [Chitinophagaceae bacterium]|nr:PKD domain-containing protein [Chitinophagaceae bacterium]
MTEAGDGSFYLEEKGFTITQYSPDDIQSLRTGGQHNSSGIDKPRGKKVRAHAYKVDFINAQTPEIVAEKPLSTYNNYFIGDDPSKWASNVKIYQAVTYKNIYPGIDIRYFVDAGMNLKYDFIVYPGANPGNIALRYSGTDAISIKNKELEITTSLGKSKTLKPYTYQPTDEGKTSVDCKYILKDSIVRFQVKDYDKSKLLVIDPTEIFFSYSGSTADNWGFTATYGMDGSFYGGGIVFGQGFPASPGSYDEDYNGQSDIAIIKLSPDGKNRIYATYIGGAGDEQPHSLIEDPFGNLVIAGRTNSQDYPVQPGRTSASGPGGGYDIIVTKLNTTGSALIGSMRIGGKGQDGVNIRDQASDANQQLSLKRNYGDDARSEVILDRNNNILVASSSSSGDFPVTPNAVQKNLGGLQDAVLLIINPGCSNIIYSTFLGGKQNDAAYVLKIGLTGNIYVAGATASSDLIGISPSGVIKSTFVENKINNDIQPDGFVLELSSDGSSIIRGTYIGTDRSDEVYGIEIDRSGFVYIMGTSEGNMPVINANYFDQGAKQFISKLKPDLSDYVYSTVFGSVNAPVPNISPTAFMVDRCENVYVSGWGGKPNASYAGGNTIGMRTTANAIKPQTDASGSDFYFFVLEKNAASQLYGSFFGQNDPVGNGPPLTYGDHVDGGTSRFDRRGYIYQAICANCFRQVAFPGTPGSWSPTNQASTPNSGMCNLGMVKIEMDFSGVKSGLQSSIDGVVGDSIGCIPLTVNFLDTLKQGKLYYWDFGDGTGDTTTAPNTSHQYTTQGDYLVRLITIDSTTCNIADTSYKTVKMGINRVSPNFVPMKAPPCTNMTYIFTNTTTAVQGTFNPNIFTWDFGDGTPPQTASFSDGILHTYAGPGTYNVRLTVADDVYCNSPQDTVISIRLSPEVRAQFDTPDAGCAPYEAEFTNNTLGGLTFFWDFGDGTTSTAITPKHLYANPGIYTVKLVAYDPTSCNLADSITSQIVVSGRPTASFNFNPIQPEENKPTLFTNLSVGAVSYLWNFGDGDTSTEKNPQHTFPATGTYNVCLTATNSFGCTADTCMDVSALIKPLLDVPKAFTPGRFGANSTIGVAGFGIAQMQWKIFNRWGQQVFESNSIKLKWDGTFNGKPQPMDVYTYTLQVTLSDGTSVRKTGDITLIR